QAFGGKHDPNQRPVVDVGYFLADYPLAGGWREFGISKITAGKLVVTGEPLSTVLDGSTVSEIVVGGTGLRRARNYNGHHEEAEPNPSKDGDHRTGLGAVVAAHDLPAYLPVPCPSRPTLTSL